MSIKQISIFVENKQGALADVTAILSEKKIDIRALSIADTADYGILRLIVDRPEDAVESLRQEAAVTVSDVLAVRMADQPGSLHSIVKVLADGGIGIEYMYAFLSKNNNEACLVLRVQDIVKAEELLQKNGFRELDDAAMF